MEEPLKTPDRCLLHLKGSAYTDMVYDRVNGENDQFRPGETYVIPVGYGREVRMIRAKCADWFTIMETPLITVFIFEKP